MIRRHATALRLLLMAADAVSAFGLFVGISVLRFGGGWVAVWRAAGLDPILGAAAYAATWIALLWLLALYRLRARWSARSEALDVGRAAVLLTLVTFSVLFFVKLPDVSRLFLLALFGAQVILTVASRFAIRWFLRTLRHRGYNARYMLVVGTG